MMASVARAPCGRESAPAPTRSVSTPRRIRRAPTPGCRARSESRPRARARRSSPRVRAPIRTPGSRLRLLLARIARARPSRASSSPRASRPSAALQRQDDVPRLRRVLRRRPFEDAGDAAPHLGFRHTVFQLREQLRRFLEARQRLLVPGQAEQRVAEHPQRLHQTIGVAGAPAQIDRGAIGLERGTRCGPAAAECAQST